MIPLDLALPPLLPAFLADRRWFGGKGRHIQACDLEDVVDLAPDGRDTLVLCAVSYRDGETERYVLMTGAREARGEATIGRAGADGPWLVEASAEAGAAGRLLRQFGRSEALATRRGGRVMVSDVSGEARHALSATQAVKAMGAEQSNTSLRIGRQFIFKLFRRLTVGENPEVEFGRFLSAQTSFRHTPALDGVMTYESPGGVRSTVGVLQRWVENEGDGWTHVTQSLRQAAGSAEARERLTRDLARLGEVSAEFHRALGSCESLGAFRPEPVSPGDVELWSRTTREDAERILGLLKDRLPDLPEAARLLAGRLVEALATGAAFPALACPAAGETFTKIRVHGDYHLGQTLKTSAGFVIIDFEGEPAKSLALRRRKTAALKDVAGMLRSFDYAVKTAAADGPSSASALKHTVDLRTPFLGAWLAGTGAPGSRLRPDAEADVTVWLRFFEFEKALYELEYELQNRPDWATIPLRGLIGLL